MSHFRMTEVSRPPEYARITLLFLAMAKPHGRSRPCLTVNPPERKIMPEIRLSGVQKSFPGGQEKIGKDPHRARLSREKPSCRKILTLCKVPEPRGAFTPLRKKARKGRTKNGPPFPARGKARPAECRCSGRAFSEAPRERRRPVPVRFRALLRAGYFSTPISL